MSRILAKKYLQRGSVYLLLTVPPLCWGANAVLARGVVDLIPPISFAFWRWTLAFLIIFPFAVGQARKDWVLVAGLFINLTPVFASIMAIVWLDEPRRAKWTLI